MKYLLDSDIITFLYDNERKDYHDAVHRKISQLNDGDELCVSVLALHELEYSFCNAPDDKKERIRQMITSILTDFDAILPINTETAPIFGKLKADLKRMKNLTRKEMRKHNIDLMLASTAIHFSSILVGVDAIYRDIARLHEQFRIENWLE